MAMFEQGRYIESMKEIILEYLEKTGLDMQIQFHVPDLANNEIDLKKPLMCVEFNSSRSIDKGAGVHNGRGGRLKRKAVRLSFQVISTGDGRGIADRDRIIQYIETDFAKPETMYWFGGRGMGNLEIRFMNSYRAREDVHVARLEMYAIITLHN